MPIWNIGNFVVIWYIFPRYGTLRQEKFGNPDKKCPKSWLKWVLDFVVSFGSNSFRKGKRSASQTSGLPDGLFSNQKSQL
jgi:hypothetical protein